MGPIGPRFSESDVRGCLVAVYTILALAMIGAALVLAGITEFISHHVRIV